MIAAVNPDTGAFMNAVAVGGGDGEPAAFILTDDGATAEPSLFLHNDEVVLVVAQSATGAGDDNWRDEKIELKLRLGGSASASLSPDIFALTVLDGDVAPVAKFNEPSFTLAEGGTRSVSLDIVEGARGEGVPEAATRIANTGTAAVPVTYGAVVSVRVGNHSRALGACPEPDDDNYNKKIVRFGLDGDDWADDPLTTFGNGGLLQTERTSVIWRVWKMTAPARQT